MYQIYWMRTLYYKLVIKPHKNQIFAKYNLNHNRITVYNASELIELFSFIAVANTIAQFISSYFTSHRPVLQED